MSAKRRDNKNRILRGGESQRKDGRYMYKYIDNAGNAKYVYSWKLVKVQKTIFHFEIRKSRYIRIWKMILFLLAVG